MSVAAKLKPRDVLEIRRRYWEGDVSERELAEMYGVTPQAIGHIVTRRNWKHIGGGALTGHRSEQTRRHREKRAKELQIIDYLTEEIDAGRLKPGDPVPSSAGLSEMFQINPTRIQAARNELVAQGILEVRRTSQGRYTYVKANDAYEEEHRALYELLRTGAVLAPQVAGRRINKHYRASVQRAAQKMWESAAEDIGYSAEEREHLRFAAQWLGYQPKEEEQ